MENQATVKEQSMLDEVLDGLRRVQKYIPSKYFYDEQGSRLFEQITRLDEYYPTRTEKGILLNNIKEIAEVVGSDAVLIELGSGSSRKTRLLLDRLYSLVAYLPVDISEEYLHKVAEKLRRDYSELLVQPVCADYTSCFTLPELALSYNKQVIFFPGSTIGNFRPPEAQAFLANLAALTDEDAEMLIGVDLKKEKGILEAAYNDKKGITAEFNKNILRRLNRELSTDFDLSKFTHRAIYNEGEGRIEMHLVSDEPQQVTIDGEQVTFEKGEYIHTENSYKYNIDEFEELVSNWFSVEKIWVDENRYFSLQYLKKK